MVRCHCVYSSSGIGAVIPLTAVVGLPRLRKSIYAVQSAKRDRYRPAVVQDPHFVIPPQNVAGVVMSDEPSTEIISKRTNLKKSLEALTSQLTKNFFVKERLSLENFNFIVKGIPPHSKETKSSSSLNERREIGKEEEDFLRGLQSLN